MDGRIAPPCTRGSVSRPLRRMLDPSASCSTPCSGSNILGRGQRSWTGSTAMDLSTDSPSRAPTTPCTRLCVSRRGCQCLGEAVSASARLSVDPDRPFDTRRSAGGSAPEHVRMDVRSWAPAPAGSVAGRAGLASALRSAEGGGETLRRLRSPGDQDGSLGADAEVVALSNADRSLAVEQRVERRQVADAQLVLEVGSHAAQG